MPVVIEQMSSAYVPIGNDTDDVIVEGDSFEREFTWEEFDGGAAIDFTGYTPSGKVKDTAGAELATLVFTTLDATGIFTMSLATLPAAGIHEYDVEIVAGSVKKTIQRGPFQITAQITT